MDGVSGAVKECLNKDDMYGLEKKINNLEIQIAVLKWMMGVMLAGVLSLVLKAFFME